MPIVSSFLNPVLQRFLIASALCCALDAGLLEVAALSGVQVHIARAISLVLATLVLLAAGKFYILGGGGQIKTTKGKPVPFHVLAIAGAILNFAIFARLLPMMPLPLDSFGRLLPLIIGGAAGIGCNFVLLHSLLPQPGGRGKHKPLLQPRTMARVVIWGLFVLLAFASSRIIAQLQDINAFPHIKLPLDPTGPDAWLRLAQVRDWLSGSGFFDHSVRNTNAPTGGITTHWTRPMDALVSLFYFLTPSHLAMNIRLLLAATWLPAALSLVTMALLGLATGRHFRHVQALGCAAIMMLVSVYKYTAPGDADHHGLLTVLWCGVLAMLLHRKLLATSHGTRALLLGALLGAMIWVSVEALVLAAMIYLLLGLESLFRPERSRVLFLAVLGAAVVATAGLFTEVPLAEIMTRLTYDSLSIVQVALLWLTALGSGVFALLCRQKFSFGARFFIASLAGAGVLFGEFFLYPKFFLGPLADADPFVLTGFLPRVIESQSMIGTASGMIVRIMMTPVLAAFLLGICLSKDIIQYEKRRFLVFLAALLGLTTLMTVFQLRWGYYLQPVAMVAIGALLPGMATAARGDTGRWLREIPRGLRTYLALGCFYLAISLLIRSPPPVTDQSLCAMQLRYVIQTQQLQPLLGEKHLTLYIPQDQGGEVQFFTPYRIIASNYHREGSGLHDLARIEAAPTAEEARPLLKERQVDALLLCPGRHGEKSWLRKLGDGKPQHWLKPVSGLNFMDMKGDKPLLMEVQK